MHPATLLGRLLPSGRKRSENVKRKHIQHNLVGSEIRDIEINQQANRTIKVEERALGNYC